MSRFAQFLHRWSRRKAAARAPPLPTAAGLDSDSSIAAYLGEEVEEALRRQALKRLFSDPRLNVMDGLDVYIDDYSIADPIPESLLAQLHQARWLTTGEPPAPSSEEDAPHPDPPTTTEDKHDEREGQTDRLARDS